MLDAQHAAEEAGPAPEPEDVAQHEADRVEELAREEQQDRGAEQAGEATAPDDGGQVLVQLVLVDRDDRGELVEHRLHHRPPAQHEAGHRHHEEEQRDEADDEVEGESGGEEHPAPGAEARQRDPEGSDHPRRRSG